MSRLDARSFYREYHGHKTADLEKVVAHFKKSRGDEAPIMWLSGDSSLDNKAWFDDTSDACNGWEDLLSPPLMKMDLSYCLNREAQARALDAVVVNCAIEESCVGQRACGRLLPQDVFIRDNIGSNDTLVVSVGGNDIALRPNLCTILNMLWLMKCVPQCCIEQTACGCALPCDDCCLGCGPGCLSNFSACPPGAGYFVHLFKTRIQDYVSRLVAKTRPRKVLVAMIYFPDEARTDSWADMTLSALGYQSNPAKLQSLIRLIFERATKQIRIPGVHVEAVPFFQVLDGRTSSDYCQRVEPSPQGGAKLARLIWDHARSSEEARASADAADAAGLLQPQQQFNALAAMDR